MGQPHFQLVPGRWWSSSHGAAGILWRLLGANNRELGRSTAAYPDAETALDAVAQVRAVARAADAHLVRDPGTGLWAWHLDVDGRVVAASGRGFRLERDGRYNLAQFRELAPTAAAGPGASWAENLGSADDGDGRVGHVLAVGEGDVDGDAAAPGVGAVELADDSGP